MTKSEFALAITSPPIISLLHQLQPVEAGYKEPISILQINPLFLLLPMRLRPLSTGLIEVGERVSNLVFSLTWKAENGDEMGHLITVLMILNWMWSIPMFGIRQMFF